MKVYIAGCITGAPEELLGWYSRLGKAFRKAGHETYVPHEDEEFSDSRVFRKDLKEMADSDLMIATVGPPSTGVGIELGLFQGPCLILYKKPLSPMVEGLADARGWTLCHFARGPSHIVQQAEELLCML
jgi:hypothetical protein